MINRAAIQQWSNHAPWIDNAQIEQDLIICRALVDIFSDEFLASQLAFRGGTALHKLYLSPQPRYRKYMEFVVDKVPSYKQFVNNMQEKMVDAEFIMTHNLSCALV